MWTPSEPMSPEATYSIACVEQPHSGWIRNSASGWAARWALMSSGLMPAWTWHSPSQTCIGFARLPLDVGAEPHVGAEQDLDVLAVLGADVLDDLDRVRGGAAVVGLGLHLGGGVDVHDDDGAGVLGLPFAQLVGGDRIRERAAGVEVGDQDGLLGREHRRGLGHEVDAAEGDHLGVGGGRLARELQRVAGEVGDLLDLRHLVVVGEDHRVARGGELADLGRERADLLR